MIDGADDEAAEEAVVVRATAALTVLSPAGLGGGAGGARAIVNVHVPPVFRCQHAGRILGALVHRRGIAAPWIGLLTAARTEDGVVVDETHDIEACVVSEVGAVAARAVKAALDDGIRSWPERRR